MKKRRFSIFVLILAIVITSYFSINGKKEKNYYVKINTEYGTVIVKLFNETPRHRDNFIKLCKQNFYDSLLFHRVIKDFMIQGGDPNSNNASNNLVLGNGGPGYTIKPEFSKNLIHKRGVIAAARLGDNSNPLKESSGSQFYIVQGAKIERETLMKIQNQRIEKGKSLILQKYIQNPENKTLSDSLNLARSNKDKILFDRVLKKIEIEAYKDFNLLDTLKYTEEQIETYINQGGTPHLDFDYTVFGEVVEGMAVVDSIANVKTDRSYRPLKDIIMNIEIINY